MSATPDILIVDDHAVVRAGCRLLLAQGGHSAVAEAGSGAEGLKLNTELLPRLVILDLELKDASGLDLIREIRAANPGGSVVIFTMHEAPAMAARAMESGASAYVSKNEGPGVFLEAVNTVLSGGIYLSHAMAQRIALQNIRSASHPLRGLTAREVEVLRLVGQGKSANEIAAALTIGYRTAANAISLIKRKLNAPTTGRLVRIAMEHMNTGA
jgi:two-component system, NarL family, invasion response regulator UvrY